MNTLAERRADIEQARLKTVNWTEAQETFEDVFELLCYRTRIEKYLAQSIGSFAGADLYIDLTQEYIGAVLQCMNDILDGITCTSKTNLNELKEIIKNHSESAEPRY